MKTQTRKTFFVAARARALVGAALLGAVVLHAGPSSASGIETGVTGLMNRRVFLLKKGRQYFLHTQNLSPNGDTIMHVVSYPSGDFIAGNDDTIISNPEGGPPSVFRESSVILAPATTDRQVWIIVRGKPGTPDGTGQLTIESLASGDAARTSHGVFPITYSQGFVRNVPSLAVNTQITTVERNGGTIDTMLMVVGPDPARTLAFDDDDGVDFMSFIHKTPTACTGGCQIIVGTPERSNRILFGSVPRTPGRVRLVWDETLHISGHDNDSDGISNELEAMVPTFPNIGDSDRDGIADGFELYGGLIRQGRSIPPGAGKMGNLLKFPRYGADPSHRDVFIEVDWVPSCPNGDGLCIATKANKQFAALQAAAANGAMASVARLHVDNGVATTDDDPVSGDWGGANMLPDSEVTFNRTSPGNYIVGVKRAEILGIDVEDDCFIDSVGARIGSFHHVIVSDQGPTGRIPDFGTTFWESAACAFVAGDGGTLTHEIGHNFNLRHGGFNNRQDGNINCKMNYASVMSYPNQFLNPFATGYSSGALGTIDLNGFTGVNEAFGLGPQSAAVLGVFSAGDLGRGLTVGNGIDWNMDGRIDTGLVRAPMNWSNTTCGAPYIQGSWYVSSGWGVTFKTLTVAEATNAKPQLFVAGDPGSSAPNSISTGYTEPNDCEPTGSNTCSTWIKRIAAPMGDSNVGPRSALAAAGPIVVYRSGIGSLAYTIPGDLSWRRPSYLGGPQTVGDPAAIEVNGRVKVYAIDSTGQLLRWEYDEASRTWPINGTPERWEDGTPNGTIIQSRLGIAVAHGAVRPDGLGVFAAIPNTVLGMANQPTPIEFARLQTTPRTFTITIPARPLIGGATIPGFTFNVTTMEDRWLRFPNIVPAGRTAPAAEFTKPGLAYAPFDTSVPTDGRFYVSWVPGPMGGAFQTQTARIMFTTGNDTTMGATVRPLTWQVAQQTMFAHDDDQSKSLAFGGVPLARFGRSVAGAAYTNGRTSFFPAADGIFNITLRDHPDQDLVLNNMACSVHGQECAESP